MAELGVSLLWNLSNFLWLFFLWWYVEILISWKSSWDWQNQMQLDRLICDLDLDLYVYNGDCNWESLIVKFWYDWMDYYNSIGETLYVYFHECILVNENVWILIKMSLKFVPKGPINHNPALVQIMALRRPGDKPLSEPRMEKLLMHLCITLPQWVKHVGMQIHPKKYANDLLFADVNW